MVVCDNTDLPIYRNVYTLYVILDHTIIIL